MGWQPVPAERVNPAAAENAGVQAGMFLIDAVHAEVDGARIDPVQVLMDPQSPTNAVYAVAAVAGPLRNYLATAWGNSGKMTGKKIEAHGTIDESRQSAADQVAMRSAGTGSAHRYVLIGTFSR